MAVAALFPSPAEVEAATPATRDRAIDIIRIVSLVGVVVGHAVMAISTLRDSVFIWSNLCLARASSAALKLAPATAILLDLFAGGHHFAWPAFAVTPHAVQSVVE